MQSVSPRGTTLQSVFPYGKQLLSMGKMKPVYYAFFDDNIMYDGEYAGITENQNIIQNILYKMN